MNRYIMALDQGTTSSRCILFNKRGNVVSLAQKELTQIYPKPGWVEHDPMEIWGSQIGVAQEALYQIGADYQNIEAIGITNQRETTVVWDRHTGKPVTNALVWQCRRTADFCDKLKKEGHEEQIRAKTGLMVDAYFSGTKIAWILEHVPTARERAEKGDLLFGTIDTWLIWNLSKGKLHITDVSNAARTMLYNINELCWDQDILALLNIPASMLPKVLPSSQIYGMTDPQIFGGPIPIASAAGDQQASLFGQTCFEPGMAKNTYGTGGFLLMNTGNSPVKSNHGLLSTIAWSVGGEVTYALEGSIFVAGAAVQWLRDELRMLDWSADSEALATAVLDTGGVYLVPAFVGLGAPYWNPYARGTIVGLSRGSNRNHLVRATLESMAYQTYDVLKAMEEDAGIAIAALKVDGGAAGNNFLMQFQSDLIQTTVERPTTTELTALGAAYLAGLAVGYWSDQRDIKENWEIEKVYHPKMETDHRIELLKGWHVAVDATLHWAEANQR